MRHDPRSAKAARGTRTRTNEEGDSERKSNRAQVQEPSPQAQQALEAVRKAQEAEDSELPRSLVIDKTREEEGAA